MFRIRTERYLRLFAPDYHLETTAFPTLPIASMTLKNTTIVQVHRPGVYPVGKPYEHIDSFDCHSHSYPENGQPDPVTIQAPYSLDQSNPPKVNYFENKNPNRAEVGIKMSAPPDLQCLVSPGPNARFSS